MTRDVNNTIKGYKMNLQEMMGSKIPAGVLTFLMKHTYFRKSLKKLKAAGFGCYTDSEIDDMGKKDLKVLSELLGEKEFFFGDEPRTLDLKAFVWLALLMNVDKEVPCPLRDFVEEECKNLVGVYNRVKVSSYAARNGLKEWFKIDFLQDSAWGDHWDEATGEKMEMNPHIPKPDPPKEEEKKEEEAEKKEDKKEEEKEKEEEKKEEKVL